MSFLSEGDSFGDSRLPSHSYNSPRRSDFPTVKIRFSSRNFGGGYSLPDIIHGSLFVPLISEGNYLHKPPWKPPYKTVDPFLFDSPSKILYPQTLFLLTMSDKLRKSVQDLSLGIDDEPVAMPPEFCYQAAHVNRFSVVVTTVNPRKQNLRALIGQMPRVWGLPESCVGRILDRGRVQFKFKSEEEMNLVLRRGRW